MKTLGPHKFTMKVGDTEHPVDLTFELEGSPTPSLPSGLEESWGSLVCESPLFSRRLRLAMPGEIALVASLMRVAAEALRSEAQSLGGKLYRFAEGDVSNDWSFYTFGAESRPFVAPEDLTPPARPSSS